MPTIYLDVLLTLNWLTDFLLLTAAARWRHLPHRRGRLVLGAAVGALGALVILLPALPPLLVAVWDAAVAAAMVRLAFAWNGWRSFLYSSAALYLLSAVFGGVAYLLWWLVAPNGFYVFNGAVYFDVSPLMLLAATLLSYGITALYDKWTRRTPPHGHTFRATIVCGERQATVRALYDTGQRLTECFSGRPVLVVRRQAVEALLPPGFERMEDEKALSSLRFRLIPFESVGGGGLLPAFCPDRLTLIDPLGQTRSADGTYVAVTDVLGRGEYDALIGDDLANLFLSERGSSV